MISKCKAREGGKHAWPFSGTTRGICSSKWGGWLQEVRSNTSNTSYRALRSWEGFYHVWRRWEADEGLKRAMSHSDLCFYTIILATILKIENSGQGRKQEDHLRDYCKIFERWWFGRERNGRNGDKRWDFRSTAQIACGAWEQEKGKGLL